MRSYRVREWLACHAFQVCGWVIGAVIWLVAEGAHP